MHGLNEIHIETNGANGTASNSQWIFVLFCFCFVFKFCLNWTWLEMNLIMNPMNSIEKYDREPNSTRQLDGPSKSTTFTETTATSCRWQQGNLGQELDPQSSSTDTMLHTQELEWTSHTKQHVSQTILTLWDLGPSQYKDCPSQVWGFLC